jgi:ketopantoate reductase
MNIAVIGSGCIGLYVGGLLSSFNGVHTRIIGRERIRKDIQDEKELIISNVNGKTVLSSSELNMETEINNQTMGDRDLILIAVKSFDTQGVAESLTRCNLKKGCTKIIMIPI